MIKNWGSQVEILWNNLRPNTKELIEVALNSKAKPIPSKNFAFDAQSDLEIVGFLSDLENKLSSNLPSEFDPVMVSNLAEACAAVLEEITSSADSFIILAKRALTRNDFARLDALADILLERFPVTEVAEIFAKCKIPQIRAIAFETLLVMPVRNVGTLTSDPTYFEIGCTVLEQQYVEYENVEAARFLESMMPKFDQ